MKIEEIIYKFMMKELTPEEEKNLHELLKEEPEYQRAFDQLTKPKKLHELYNAYKNINLPQAWEKNEHLRNPKLRRYKLIKTVSLAASVLILLGVSIFLLHRPESPKSISSITSLSPASIPERPGTRNVKIIANSTTYPIQDTIDLKQRENSLAQDEKLLNLVVGHGNSFHFKLSDGSEVHLNAGSEIKYPREFNQDCREIYVSGEVFLQVMKDTKRPFIVRYGQDNSVRVLGTSFNIKAYPDENESFVTLVNGSIQFNSGNDSIRLSPSEQLVHNQTTRQTEIKTIDPTQYTAWMQNRFAFKYETLESISQELSRWYGVKFKFENHAQKRFTGGFSRYENIEKILTLLAETTQINFSIQDSCIIVK